MDLPISRNYGPDATTGTCPVGDKTLCTIEQPWRNDQQGHSCVPATTYDLIPYTSPTHGPTWCLHNPSVGVAAFPSGMWPDGHPLKAYEAPSDGNVYRTVCELHSANWVEQLEGCTAFGMTGQPMYDPLTGRVEVAIEDSKSAIAYLQSVLGVGAFGHTITYSPAPSL